MRQLQISMTKNFEDPIFRSSDNNSRELTTQKKEFYFPILDSETFNWKTQSPRDVGLPIL